MAKRKLSARDVERLENTSLAPPTLGNTLDLAKTFDCCTAICSISVSIVNGQ